MFITYCTFFTFAFSETIPEFVKLFSFLLLRALRQFVTVTFFRPQRPLALTQLSPTYRYNQADSIFYKFYRVRDFSTGNAGTL